MVMARTEPKAWRATPPVSTGEEPAGKTNSIAAISRPSSSVQGQIEAMGVPKGKDLGEIKVLGVCVSVRFIGNGDVVGMRRRNTGRGSALGIFLDQRFPRALGTSESRRDKRRRPSCSCRLIRSIGNCSDYLEPSRILLGLCRRRRRNRLTLPGLQGCAPANLSS